jgi:hypothetical protein
MAAAEVAQKQRDRLELAIRAWCSIFELVMPAEEAQQRFHDLSAGAHDWRAVMVIRRPTSGISFNAVIPRASFLLREARRVLKLDLAEISHDPVCPMLE